MKHTSSSAILASRKAGPLRKSLKCSVLTVCEWAASELGLTTLEIVVHEDNTPSIRVARSAGFTEAGERRVAPREGLPEGRYLVHVWQPGRAG